MSYLLPVILIGACASSMSHSDDLKPWPEANPGEEKRAAFVAVNLEDPMLRDNSKLPIVVYVPDGFSVRYRTWSVDGDAIEASIE